MIKSLDEIPYGEMPKWGQTARFFLLMPSKNSDQEWQKNEKQR